MKDSPKAGWDARAGGGGDHGPWRTGGVPALCEIQGVELVVCDGRGGDI